MELNDPITNVRKLGIPRLRDIEWTVFYYWEEALGFSGFSLDDTYSCLRLLDQEVVPEKLIRAKYPEAVNSEGELKKYYPTREYLQKTHPSNMGKPLYRNPMKNFMLVGPRGWGKSYIIANLSAYEFLFDGIVDYDDYLKKAGKGSTRTNTIVSAADSKYTDATISKTKLTLDNMRGAIEVDGKFYPAPLSKQYEGSFSKKITAQYRQKIGGN